MYYAGVYNVYYTFSSSFECEGGSHVKHMHAVSLLIHSFGNPLLIRFQTVRNSTFDPVRTNSGESKMKIRTVYQSRDHELFEIPLLIHLQLYELDQK